VCGERPALSVAGRTDAGVHAWGQVASFPYGGGDSAERLAAGLNGVLPPDLVVRTVEAAPDGFDARRDALSRTYCYRLLARSSPGAFERNRALWVPAPLDEAALRVCAAALQGNHDFTAFTPTQTEHVRFDRDVLDARWEESGDIVEFWIEADTFMRHMVRILVGTMLEVSAGRMDVDEFGALLAGAPRSQAGPTAAPHGLYLASVRY
jgi:tRNA pseudouridine38-40 synthase